jgi:hypothetical protein
MADNQETGITESEHSAKAHWEAWVVSRRSGVAFRHMRFSLNMAVVDSFIKKYVFATIIAMFKFKVSKTDWDIIKPRPTD